MKNYIYEFFDRVDISRGMDFKGEDLCNISDFLLLELCGGMPTNDVAYIRLEIRVTNSCVYDIEVTTDLYSTLRTINFETKIIYNYLMIVEKRNCGIATNLLYNQIKTARKFGFNYISTSANRGNRYNGFYMWGRIGYTMSAQQDLDKFNEWCVSNGFKKDTLFNILQSEEGQQKWKETGFTWQGTFDLSEQSENIDMFKIKLAQIGLNDFAELL